MMDHMDSMSASVRTVSIWQGRFAALQDDTYMPCPALELASRL